MYNWLHVRLVIILQSHDLICHQKKLNIKDKITRSAIIYIYIFVIKEKKSYKNF